MTRHHRRQRNPLSVSAGGLAALLAMGGVLALGVYLYRKRQKIADSLNPVSDQNIVYQGGNAIVQAITGNKIDSIGTSVANWFKSDAEKAVDAMLKPNQ